MHQLYPFQALAKNQIRQAFIRTKRVLYQAGTGSGKTVVASSIIKDAAEKGKSVWFLAHRRELIEQSHKTLYEWGVNNGIIMAGYKYHPGIKIQCASIDTLRERLIKGERLVVPYPPDLIVIDECHRALSKSYRDLCAEFPEAWQLGLTATPIRSDGRGLGHAYDQMVQAPSVSELIEMGFLVQPRYFIGAHPNLEGLKISNYDYAQGALQARMNNADLRGDVVTQWLRHAEGRKTIVFAAGVKHSMALRDDFLAAGISAMHIDGNTLTSERMDLFHEFRTSDKYQVLCNCNIATEGVDVPEVGCVQIATATRIISRYLQMGGRGLRTHQLHGDALLEYKERHGENNPDRIKTDCIIIDHGDNIIDRDGVMKHGFLEDPVPWVLDTEGRITDRIPEVRENDPREFVCEACGCVFQGQIVCPECGTRLEVHGQHELICSAEELIEVTRGAMGVRAADQQKVYTEAQRKNFLSQVVGYASGMNKQRKTYKVGWAMHTYRKKFGEMPTVDINSVIPSQPEPATIAFINAQFAAYQIRQRYAR